jgi:hypothetical protein
MGKRRHSEDGTTAPGKGEKETPVPKPTASYRRRAWVQFQRALDPLAPIKPLPPPRG